MIPGSCASSPSPKGVLILHQCPLLPIVFVDLSQGILPLNLFGKGPRESQLGKSSIQLRVILIPLGFEAVILGTDGESASRRLQQAHDFSG